MNNIEKIIDKVDELIVLANRKYNITLPNIDIKFGPKRIGDIPHSKASINKAKHLLNYKPSHFFKEGITETIRWYMNQ